MRSRKQIELGLATGDDPQFLAVELLLDMRDILVVANRVLSGGEANVFTPSEPTIIKSFPGEAVDRHLKLYGHLPSEGCCEHDQ